MKASLDVSAHPNEYQNDVSFYVQKSENLAVINFIFDIWDLLYLINYKILVCTVYIISSYVKCVNESLSVLGSFLVVFSGFFCCKPSAFDTIK